MNNLTTYQPREVNLVAQFLGGLSQNTRDAYQRGLEQFAEFIGMTPSEAASWLIQDHGQATLAALDYRESLAGLAPNTVNQRLSAIRKIVAFARDIGMIEWTLKIQGPRAQVYRDTRGPGMEAVAEIIEASENPRDTLLIRMCFQMGLRRAEVQSLDVESIDGDKIWVLEKRRQDRTALTLPSAVRLDLDAWLVVRGSHPGPLITNNRGGRISLRGINRIVERCGERVGVRCTPHGFRHTAITEAARLTGGDVIKVMQFSRHTKMETVKHYVDVQDDGYGKIADMLGQ